MLNDFSDIKSTYKMSDKNFTDNLEFCLLITERVNKADAYMKVFEETDRKKASTYATRLLHSKAVSRMIDRLIAGNHILFADKHYGALEALYEIGMNGSDEKNRVQALGKFIDATKRPEAKDVTVNLNVGSEMLDKLEESLMVLANNAKMIMRDGSIIDAELIK
jgi:hypothetical protein